MTGRSPSITRRSIEAAMRTVDAGNSASVILRDDRVPGLSLAIGARSQRWRLDYKLPLPDGRWSAGKRLTLGDLAQMDINAARTAAGEAKAGIADGVDPVSAKRAKRQSNVEAGSSQTVADAIDRYVDERSQDWTEGTRAHFRGDFALIRAEIGDAPMALIERKALTELIDRFLRDQRRQGAAGTTRAIRIAQLLAGLWKQAGPGTPSRPGWEWQGIDPQVAAHLPITGRHRLVSRRRVLSEAEIRVTWPVLRDGIPDTLIGPAPRLVLMLSLVTGLRIGAIALTRVRDLDLDPVPLVGARDNGPTIRIPAEDGRKMTAKDRREGSDLVLPLSPLAARLFREAMTQGDGEHVFPGKPSGTPLSPNTVSRAWRTLADAKGSPVPSDATAHDLRRTMRTHLGEIDHGGAYEDEERLIGHRVGGTVARTYDRGRRLARLRPLADAWGTKLEAIVTARVATVTQLQGELS
ncbi:tyrosine-type recombinase/integrase [Microbaculum marinum]|uniref:Integrase arm-type DNA-binding domain-containing protein n=1 Tax=Microbaculum marinum TaxID=1764581 RepID=A0AAW9RT05_9HYPH